jgi:hypothetical protein
MKIMVPEIDEIVNFYSAEVVEEIARETGFVQRESKLGGIEFLGIMTQGLYFRPDATLDQMVAMGRDINKELEISPEGLHQRINHSGVEFLKKMLSKAMELSVSRLIDESVPRILESFGKVHVLDSTQASLPEELSEIWKGSGGCASEAGMKFHLMLDYKGGKYESIDITDGISPDQNYIDEAIKRVNPGELLIDDLGYFKQEAVMDIDQRGAYFLCRFNHRNNLYREEDGKLVKFDLLVELKKAQRKGETLCEFHVWFHKHGRQVKMRLTCEIVPEEVAEDRRKTARKVARKKKRKPTGKHLFFLGWNLYITNVEETILETKSVGLVHKVRWYVELVFKSWKSYHGLTQVRGKRKERIECFIYGRLIMMTIMAFLNGCVKRNLWNTRRREASFLKVVRHFQVKAHRFLCLMTDPIRLARFLWDEFLEACRLCKMDIRKRLSTAQKLRNIQIPCDSTALT